jgi:hypothetical protein
MRVEEDRALKIGREMQALAEYADLEANGHHADGLIKKLDPTDNKVIAKKLEQLNPAHRTSKAISNTMRALQRRKSRGIAARLLKHR